jgi:hypothetical protein
MSNWTPDWKITINAVEYTDVTLSNLTITSGRTDIYTQAFAGYCSVRIINLNESPILIDTNNQISIQVKDTSGNYVSLFGGFVTDIDVEVTSASSTGITQAVTIIALGALSKLPKTLYVDPLAKAFDGDQIYAVLSQALFNTWNEVPAALSWADYNHGTIWANAENAGLGDIDRPGNYELAARSADTIDMASLVNGLATSGLGYLYEDADGRIGYADSTHRAVYVTENGYLDLSGNHALVSGIKTSKRIGDIRNNVTITYKNGQQESASDANSIALYGQQAYNLQTSLENGADAEAQAQFYLTLRAYPEALFRSITFPLQSPEIDDSDRDNLLNVFMGLGLDIQDLPSNINGGQFQGFVEGWTFQASFNGLYLTLTVSPLEFSLQQYRWNSVPITESWSSVSPILDWQDATVVA